MECGGHPKGKVVEKSAVGSHGQGKKGTQEEERTVATMGD